MNRTMRTNVNSLHSSLKFENKSSTSTLENYKYDYLPDIAAIKAAIVSSTTNVAGHKHRKKKS